MDKKSNKTLKTIPMNPIKTSNKTLTNIMFDYAYPKKVKHVTAEGHWYIQNLKNNNIVSVQIKLEEIVRNCTEIKRCFLVIFLVLVRIFAQLWKSEKLNDFRLISYIFTIVLIYLLLLRTSSLS